MALKEEIEYIKQEISTEEKFFESFFKLEKFYKKHKIKIISIIGLVIITVAGYGINDYLQKKYPRCYINGVFALGANKHLKYVSSYEIDYEIGVDNSDKVESLGALAWHLGLKEKGYIDKLTA